MGGTLSNWRTIKNRLDRMAELEAMKERGELERFTKKEQLMRTREIDRLNRKMGGIKNMRRLPEALFIVDVSREENAIKESNKLGIPVIAMVDTNCDPDGVDYIIPSNDDAIRAIKLIVEAMSNAALEGLALRKGVDSISEVTGADDKVAAGEQAVVQTDESLVRSFAPDADDDEES
jgi:small subunit ribosomal protein S2